MSQQDRRLLVDVIKSVEKMFWLVLRGWFEARERESEGEGRTTAVEGHATGAGIVMFLDAFDGGTPARNPRDAFVTFVPLLDEWRVISYVDPGLPPSMTPEDWPGTRAVATFETARERLYDLSMEWVVS